MSIWTDIGDLAKELLDQGKVKRVNLSEVSREVHRPEGSSQKLGGRQKAVVDDLSGVEVLPEYKFIQQALAKGCPALFVTGKAGTGKSTMIRFLRSKLNRCAVIAPTAIAAENVGGQTIHSFFGIPPRALNPDEAIMPSKHMRPVIENLGALIVDEVSMVGPDLIDCMDQTLQKVRGNSQPFGGVPVILVGDILQLPPVVKDKEVGIYFSHYYESAYFYSAKVFEGVDIVPVELRRVFRQEDAAFIQALDAIRTGEGKSAALELLNRQCLQEFEEQGEDATCLVPTNAIAKSINDYHLNKIDEELHTFDAIYSGELKQGTARFQAPDRLQLKVGAKVIFVRNNRPNWLNGTLGEVVAIEADKLSVRILETGNILNVSRESWKKYKYRYNHETSRIEFTEVGTFTQFPLTLGWAITIHKSQGMTMDQVRIDMGGGAFCSGQTYVALSRCRTMAGITLSRAISERDVKVDDSIIQFYKKLGFLEPPEPITIYD